MAPSAAAIRFMNDLGAQLTASLNQLCAGFYLGRKTGEPGEKPSKQSREPTQTQPTMASGRGDRTWTTLGDECSDHRATFPFSSSFWHLYLIFDLTFYITYFPSSLRLIYIRRRAPESKFSVYMKRTGLASRQIAQNNWKMYSAFYLLLLLRFESSEIHRWDQY